MMKKNLIICLAGLFALTACNKKNDGWTLNGEIPTDVQSVTLEQPLMTGGWYTSDSITPDSTGHFTIKKGRASESIYRLKIDGKYIYLPADSTETLTLVVPASGGHSLDGSHEAILFSEVDRILSEEGDSDVQRNLLELLQNDFDSSAAYYANLRLKGQNRTLLRAITNAYVNNRPTDPRTDLLRYQLAEANKSAKPTGQQQVVIEAPEVGYFDITLMDKTGRDSSLSSVVNAHKVTLLAFVNFAIDSAPAINILIGNAKDAYPALGIYEVGFALEQHQWISQADSLPWPTVFQSESASQTHIGQYAVTSLPTMFVIVDGEIKERVQDPPKLTKILSKYF